ncbi:MAG: hypothetical protein JXR14_07575 [Paracoccaceae bacterium]
MLEPDVTLTDYALTIQCAVFGWVLLGRMRRGAGSTLSARFAALFFALAAASAIGGTYHGFFSETKSLPAEAVWLATLLVIGAVSFCTWLIAGKIQFEAAGQRLVFWIATLQFLAYAVCVVFISRDFLIASASAALPMVILLVGYVRAFVSTRDRRVAFGLLGILIAFFGAALQQMQIGLHPEYFNHNSVYHVVQFVAFAFLFSSISGLERHLPSKPAAQ